MTMRNYPYPDIIKAIDLFKKNGGKCIVEIGSMRQPVDHDLDQYGKNCCQEGHSSLLFARAAKQVSGEMWTVDADPEATRACARELIRHGYGDAFVVCAGAIQFLTAFPNKIDLWYADCWDTDLPQSASEHLRAYHAVKDKLNKKCIILIDDTDPFDGGKGRLLVPAAVSDGWKLVWAGRTTLLKRGF